ncbi:MAG: bifunctional 5,10-methylenetetrahydrofolate dehydrogenase/5,10-methenyltetrahydrofolate cyclohydrolase [Patescibacteria group bacterium]|nr:bifunctional 5,10-methylenetetrahydrofolate dehydrogenase/5,10-methenyltetrahydrofolate cyclohydrolase [Patescibacteria group bacterium]
MILRGDKLAKEINKETKKEIQKFKITPGLAVILIGNNLASKLYVELKEKTAKQIKINFYKFYFSEKAKENEILKIITELNQDKNVSGIIVQLPLPEKFNTNKIVQCINSKKDVDGFHKQNIKSLLTKKSKIISPLILAVINILKSTKQNLSDKSAVIISKNKIFVKPLKIVLQKEKIACEKIEWVKEINKKTIEKIELADIVIVGIGKARILKKEMIKKNAIVIDIGINKENNKVVGDADFKNLKNKASFITPVPKGVGPMTVAMLMKNVLKLSR